MNTFLRFFFKMFSVSVLISSSLLAETFTVSATKIIGHGADGLCKKKVQDKFTNKRYQNCYNAHFSEMDYSKIDKNAFSNMISNKHALNFAQKMNCTIEEKVYSFQCVIEVEDLYSKDGLVEVRAKAWVEQVTK